MDDFIVLTRLYNRTPDASLASRILPTLGKPLIVKFTGKFPLYVYRPVLNAKDIQKWFKAQGCKKLSKRKDFHVTCCFSKEPVDWSKFTPENSTIEINHTKGREVTQLGDSVVQKLKSKRLEKHHQRFRDGGASWDFPSYMPHVSFMKADDNDIKIKKLKPYTGKIVLGPERFEPINPEFVKPKKVKASTKIKPYSVGDKVHYMGRLHNVETAIKQHKSGSYNYRLENIGLVNHDWINHEFSERKTQASTKDLNVIAIEKIYRTLSKDPENFEEDKHPRAKDGEFATKQGDGSTKTELAPHHKKNHGLTKIVDGKRVTANGEPLPPHIEALKIPPAWKDVSYAIDPDNSLLATGKDSKGRPQAIYSLAHSQRQAEAKFARVSELTKKYKGMYQQNHAARKSSINPIKDAADCTFLIMKMGIRPGSEEDTGAKVKAYGATNMLGKHVVVDDKGKVTLEFTGKKGVELKLPVDDKEVADMLVQRKKDAGDNDKPLFPHTNEKRLLSHVHSLGGKAGFKTKDLRTHLGCKLAANLVAKMPEPKNSKEYQKQVMEVAKHVSKKLGNTPTIALQSYINPAIFSAWKTAT